jgi:hypothetical protein
VLSWGNDDSARVWDARSGREITRHQGGVDGAAFAVDGRRVLSWGGSSVHVWDATSGRDIARQTLEEYTYGSVFAPDGRRVLSWSSDGTSRVWDSTSGSEMAQHAHGGSVRGGLFSRDGGRVLSWSNDGTARVWDVRWSIARASNRSLIAEVCDRKLRESVAPASSAQPDGGTLPDASIRRITPLDAAAAPMLSGRVGEDVCRSSDWLSETAEWLTRAVMGPRN